MDEKKKGEYIGAIGALLLHMLVIALLILVTFAVSHDQEESGVPVMLGNTDAAMGNYDPSTMIDVDVLPPEELPDAQPQEISEDDMITQTEEETVVVKPKPEPKKEKPKEVKKPEKTVVEKAAEAKRLAEARAEQERLAAAEATTKRVSGAFGKGVQMGGDKGTSKTGTGSEGSREGNSSTGAKTGVGGNGTFELGGRSLAKGSSLDFKCEVSEEGRVVVDITVAPSGMVIRTSINLRKTNTTNPVLRREAENAAKKARFDETEGVNNQQGIIIYNFRYT